MPRPDFTYVKIDDHLAESRKLSGKTLAEKEQCGGALAFVLGFCRRQLNDGLLTRSEWRKVVSAQGRRLLIDCRFAEEVPEGIYIRHYLDYYPSRADVEELSEKRRKAGSKGGRIRQLAKQVATPGAKQVAKQVATPGAKQVAKALLNPESDTEAETDLSSVPASPAEVEGGSPTGKSADDDDDPEAKLDSGELELARVVQRAIHLRTGTTMDAAAAATLAQMLLPEGRRVANPAAYIARAIRDEPNPQARFLPRELPPSWKRPAAYPAPEVAKGGAELARELMRSRQETARDDDTMPF
jgi:hypothetical protein